LEIIEMTEVTFVGVARIGEIEPLLLFVR